MMSIKKLLITIPVITLAGLAIFAYLFYFGDTKPKVTTGKVYQSFGKISQSDNNYYFSSNDKKLVIIDALNENIKPVLDKSIGKYALVYGSVIDDQTLSILWINGKRLAEEADVAVSSLSNPIILFQAAYDQYPQDKKDCVNGKFNEAKIKQLLSSLVSNISVDDLTKINSCFETK